MFCGVYKPVKRMPACRLAAVVVYEHVASRRKYCRPSPAPSRRGLLGRAALMRPTAARVASSVVCLSVGHTDG